MAGKGLASYPDAHPPCRWCSWVRARVSAMNC